MTKEDNGNGIIVLPALRGIVGTWIYYSCLMSFKEVCNRVSYPHEIRRSKKLSNMIQRELDEDRGNRIATYIKTQEERFFNSLVVGTYQGKPKWYGLEEYSNDDLADNIKNLIEEEVNSLGFLELTGGEKMFAIDGQHRLSGIKKAVEDDKKIGEENTIPVIFIGHEITESGITRTRRLFTTLNKNARPVSKAGIIALDEDDVMAITTRWLIEDEKLFEGERIAYVAQNNIPYGNYECLLTIGILYDVLEILFLNNDLRKDSEAKIYPVLEKLRTNRPPDKDLQEYFQNARNFFNLMRDNFEEINEFFSAGENYPEVTKKYRKHDGGSILFRPTGFKLFVVLIVTLAKHMPMKEAMERVSKLPRNLNAEPYINSIWDGRRIRRIDLNTKNILLYMAGGHGFSEARIDLMLRKYRNAIGDDKAELPDKVVQDEFSQD